MKPVVLIMALYTFVVASSVVAQDPVFFPDVNLKTAVEDALWISDPTPADLLGLTDLKASVKGIGDLTGLEYAANLQELDLRENLIGDISALSTLSKLRTINLSKNTISDLGPLSGLNDLRYLDIHMNKIVDVSPLSGLGHLETLIIRFNEIHDISGLSGLPKLKKVILRSNEISDISPLAGLHELEYIDLFNNEIGDLSPLASLKNLQELHLFNAQDGDISPLAGLKKLKILGLKRNGISDISPLADLRNLEKLMLHYNPIREISALTRMTGLRRLHLERTALNPDARCSHLQTIGDNNPGIYLVYDASNRAPHTVIARASASSGGAQITWGTVCNGPSFTSYYRVSRSNSVEGPKTPMSEWQTASEFYDLTAELGAHYVYWVQTATDATGSNAGDYSVPAFLTAINTLYVDDDATGDMGPANATLSDPFEDGTAEHPFDRIQEAIEAATDGTQVFVNQGIYHENINFLGKKINLTSIDRNDPNATDFPMIVGAEEGPIVQFVSGEDPNCTMKGFVITRGRGGLAGGVYCQDSSPTITNCLIVGNRASAPGGAAVNCRNSRAILAHCTIADNVGGVHGAAIIMENSACVLTHSIVWNNSPQALVLTEESETLITFTNIAHIPGQGNFHADPLFANPGFWANPNDLGQLLLPSHPEAVWIDGDYHLRSEAGRWNPVGKTWIYDSVTSPCIDAGDPAEATGDDLITPNMGAYGLTSQASRSF